MSSSDYYFGPEFEAQLLRAMLECLKDPSECSSQECSKHGKENEDAV